LLRKARAVKTAVPPYGCTAVVHARNKQLGVQLDVQLGVLPASCEINTDSQSNRRRQLAPAKKALREGGDHNFSLSFSSFFYRDFLGRSLGKRSRESRDSKSRGPRMRCGKPRASAARSAVPAPVRADMLPILSPEASAPRRNSDSPHASWSKKSRSSELSSVREEASRRNIPNRSARRWSKKTFFSYACGGRHYNKSIFCLVYRL